MTKPRNPEISRAITSGALVSPTTKSIVTFWKLTAMKISARAISTTVSQNRAPRPPDAGIPSIGRDPSTGLGTLRSLPQHVRHASGHALEPSVAPVCRAQIWPGNGRVDRPDRAHVDGPRRARLGGRPENPRDGARERDRRADRLRRPPLSRLPQRPRAGGPLRGRDRGAGPSQRSPDHL